MSHGVGGEFSRRWRHAITVVSLAGVAGCGGGSKATPPAGSAGASPVARASSVPGEDANAPLPPPDYEAALPEGVRAILSSRFTGDLDQMAERRLIRIGVPFNRTFYFVDKGVQRGAAYELGQAFEEQLNKKRKTRDATRIRVVFVPLPRDLLAPALTQGKVDLVVAQVTIRPELLAIVDFSNPTRTNVSEVVVTGPGAPALATVDDLAGKDVYARKDSSAWQGLVDLNARLKKKGLAAVGIREVPGNLEDDDLLEMANAGLLPAVVVQDYMADFWKQVFPNLTVHHPVAVRTGASLGVAMRKHSPQLKAELDAFLAKNGLGTALGNVIMKRYLVSTTYVKQATAEAERKKFLELVNLFRKYGDQYQMDYLLMAAQGYQESGLDQSVKSRVGAIGVMQVMPATGRELGVGDITKMDANIHAGVKYMRFMIDQYFKDEPMDTLNKGLFAFASYNAGPARVRQLRREAEKRGLDPNVWFGNVEQIASERVGRETVTYVSNIYKYYVAYRLIAEERVRRDEAKKAMRPGGR